MKHFTLLTIVLFLFAYCLNGQTRCVVNIHFEENDSDPPSYTFSTDFEGDAVKYLWHFSDKTVSEEPSPVHVFKYSGNYGITLRIIDSDRNVCYARITGYFKGSEELPAPPQLLHARGVVNDFSSTDGCGLMIVTDKEEVLNPQIIIQNFVLKEGQRVAFTYEVITPEASICMAGTSVRIHRIVELPEPPIVHRAAGVVVDHSETSGCGLLVESENRLFVPAVIIPDLELVAGQQIHFVYEIVHLEEGTCPEGQMIKIYKIMEITPKPVICLVIPLARPIDIRNKSYQFFARTNAEVEQWLWDFGDGSISSEAEPAHQYQLPGIYTVTCSVTTSEGCEASKTFDLPVREFHLPLCPGTMNLKLLDPTEEQCNGEASASLFDENGVEFENVTYLWSTGEAGPVASNLCSDRIYRIKALVPGVCYRNSAFTLLSKPRWNLFVTGGIYTFEVINPLEGATYQWEFSTGDTFYGPVITYNFGAEGRYRVRLTVISESDAASAEEEIILEKSATGIEDGIMNNFSVYPNPAHKTLFIHSSVSVNRSLQVEITDLQGRMLTQKSIPAGTSSTVRVNVQDLSPGLYLIRLILENGVEEVKKFTIANY